jgi:hypothetical protein
MRAVGGTVGVGESAPNPGKALQERITTIPRNMDSPAERALETRIIQITCQVD